MSVISHMLDTYPGDLGTLDRRALIECIDACAECSQACTACADACLGEAAVSDLTNCIRTDLDCADICETTMRVVTRRTGFDADVTRALVEACRVACAASAEECEQHASMHEHCKICAESCRRCEQACAVLLKSL